ncbi:MAG TPA: hypothetical protein VG248_12050 [Caulobacteraceae bacterium]|nr:hypothetical protein [Caulobacteraceae bacterium]
MSGIDRRSALAAVLGLAVPGVVAAQPAEPPSAARSAALEARVAAAALAARLIVRPAGEGFAGPGWDRLLEEGRRAQFFLIGEEHGIAENPRLAGSLFASLSPAGYERLALEISPPMATLVGEAARSGVAGLRALFSDPRSRAPFVDLAEEAAFVASAARVRRPARGGGSGFLWGLDFDLEADRLLIAALKARAPRSAGAAVAALQGASLQSWARYDATHNPRFIYSFAGDPALVRAVRSAWPDPDPASSWILTTLEETLEINALQVAGRGYAANARRSALIRANFLRYWALEKASGRAPRALIKMGASHMVRGASMVETFDLGSLLPEIAAIEGRPAFSLLVLPGAGAKTAVFDPSRMRYEAAPPKDHYRDGLSPILDQAAAEGFSLFDMRPLRPILDDRAERLVSAPLMRVVHGFDAVLVMTGSTPSTNLIG